MPVWHERTKEWVRDGRLVVLGITQEQHPERCALYAQWKQFDFPILHDPINLMQSEAVPLFVAIDEHGIVRSTRPRPDSFAAEFIERDFDGPEVEATTPSAPDLEALARAAEENNDTHSWNALGNARVLWALDDAPQLAIEAYERALAISPNPATLFRLGVAYRMRHESPAREPGDFGRAVALWGQALDANPNQYIWRRRIQQYGPRLAKPYPFYDWVEEARAAIVARGEEPVPLPVEPYGAELATPSKQFEAAASGENPDPEGRIRRDDAGLIQAEIAVVPAVVKPGESARVHVTLTPNAMEGAWWNNEADGLRLWIDAPEGWQVSQQLLEAALPAEVESRETRRLDFEVSVPKDASGATTFTAYALYGTCEDQGGQCLYLRRDLEWNLEVNS